MDNKGFLHEVPKEVLIDAPDGQNMQMMEVACPHCGKKVKINVQAQITLCPNTQCRKLIALVS